jgi:hypothetical protein
MSELKAVDSPTLRLHKQQVVWQIIVPFTLVTLILLAAGVWLVWCETARARVWADVSIIWLLVPMLFLTLVALALSILLIVGMAKLLQVTPRFTARAQQVAGQVADGTRQAADGAAKPFIWVEQAGAVIKSIFKFKR